MALHFPFLFASPLIDSPPRRKGIYTINIETGDAVQIDSSRAHQLWKETVKETAVGGVIITMKISRKLKRTA